MDSHLEIHGFHRNPRILRPESANFIEIHQSCIQEVYAYDQVRSFIRKTNDPSTLRLLWIFFERMFRVITTLVRMKKKTRGCVSVLNQ